jgi:glycosyltransferase involved in cell wall biosynthesis
MTECDDYIRRFTKTKLDCGKSLIELTEYDDSTLWWFARNRFHYFMGRTLNEDLENRSNRFMSLRMVYKTIEPYFDISRMILVRVLLNLHKKEKRHGLSDGEKVPQIFFTAQDLEWRVIRDYGTNSTRKSDAFFDSIMRKSLLRDKCVFVGVYPLGISIRGLRVFIDKLGNWYIQHKPFDLYWSPNAWKKERDASKYFGELWRDLDNDETLERISTYNGKDLYILVKTELKFYFCFLFPRVVKQIEMARRMISKEKPDLVLLQNEYGEFEQALTVAAKQQRTPSMAIQHGIIIPTHYGYIFDKDDEGKVILPDMTCVYGQYHYDLLTNKSVYGPEQVVVTGQPRYDILYYASKTYSRTRFLKKYNVTPDHRILLWTTQCHGISDEENARNFATVFGVMQNIKNVTLLMKQHPSEGERYTKIIEDYLAKYKIDAILAPKSSDTYEQLFFCDLLMTKSSTTAMEAMALNKPVVILNLSGGLDDVDYVEQGVALGVYRGKELRSAIEELLKDDSSLAKNRQRYVEKYLYRIDGKATERVANVIQAIIRDAGKKG